MPGQHGAAETGEQTGGMRPLEFGGEFFSSKHDKSPHDAAAISDGHEYEACLTDIFFPELVEWGPVLRRLCVPFQAALDIAARAREKGCSFQSALLVSGAVDEVAFVKAVAGHLGLGVIETIDPERLVINDKHAAALLRGRSGQVPIKLLERDGAVSFLITCERIDLKRLGEWLASHPALVKSLKMTEPRLLRAAIVARAQPLLVKSAVNRLFERFPDMSARMVANAWQGAMVGIALTVLPVGFVLAPDRTLAALHGLATFFFFACVMLRFAVVASARPPPANATIPIPEGDVPVYAVFVALYKEADIVPSLLVALDRIAWPRERLEVKLVCEADDVATLTVIAAMDLPSHIEVIEVPPCEPRTKPKALAYALPMTSAEFIALYDAEDWPEPMQLAEAWQRFKGSGPELAVLQAPLEISNPSSGLIARMFAFEYAGLFRGMLPWLTRTRLVFPLGGTSNHFRGLM